MCSSNVRYVLFISVNVRGRTLGVHCAFIQQILIDLLSSDTTVRLKGRLALGKLCILARRSTHVLIMLTELKELTEQNYPDQKSGTGELHRGGDRSCMYNSLVSYI